MSDTATTSAPTTHRTPGAHFADPAPLGLAAFGFTTFLLMTVDAGWLPQTLTPVVVRAGPGLRRDRPVRGRPLGVRQGQHLRRHGLLLLRRLLGLLLVADRRTTTAQLPAADAHKAVGIYLIAWASSPPT